MKKKKATLIAAILAQHSPNPEIPFKRTNPYTLLIAVHLSAHAPMLE